MGNTIMPTITMTMPQMVTLLILFVNINYLLLNSDPLHLLFHPENIICELSRRI